MLKMINIHILNISFHRKWRGGSCHPAAILLTRTTCYIDFQVLRNAYLAAYTVDKHVT